MESWQKIYIWDQLPALVTETTVNDKITAPLISEKVLSHADVEKLNAIGDKDGNTSKAKVLYDQLVTRTNGYKAIAKATFQSMQSGAFLLLLKGLVQHLLKESNINLNEETINEILNKGGLTGDVWQFFAAKVDNCTLNEDNWIAPTYPIYISRHISNRIKLQPNVFKKDCSDIFVFTGITRPDLSKLAAPNPTTTSNDVIIKSITTVRFVILINEKDWEKLGSVWSEPVHLIQFDSHSGDYILQQSTKASEVVSGHVPLHLRDKSLYVPEDHFLSQIDNGKHQGTICICDTPGMGKTLLLENLARQAHQSDSGRLNVVIGLQKFVQQVQTSMHSSKSIQILLRYLWPFQLLSTLSEKALENDQLQVQLFLDGFDEIPREHLQSTLNFFKSIAGNQRNVNLFVTSRPHMRKELEKTFKAVAYDILPFSEENQVDFLVSYWQTFAKHPMDLQLAKLTIFAKECLTRLMESLTKEESSMMGIPLICYMLAAVTLTNAELYCHQDSTGNINEYISPISLYDMYKLYLKMGIEREIRIFGGSNDETEVPRSRYHHLKMYIGKAYVFTKGMLTKTTSTTSSCTEPQKLKAFHVWKALELLIPDLAEDYRQSESIPDIEVERILACGILQSCAFGKASSTSTMTFLHRTFAEYLIGEHFADFITTRHNSMNNEMLKKYLETFVSQILATQDKKNLRKLENLPWRLKSLVQNNNYYIFSSSTIVYFLNTSLQNSTVMSSDVLPQILMEFLKMENFQKILNACITSSYTNIIRVFKHLLKPLAFDLNSGKQLLRDLFVNRATLNVSTDGFNPDKYYLSTYAYICQAAKMSNVRVLEELYSLFEECIQENLKENCFKIPKNVATPLHYAVQRLDYSLVEFFAPQITLPERNILFYLPEVDENNRHKAIEICELLLGIEGSIVFENLDYKSTFGNKTESFSIITHVRNVNLIKVLVQRGARLTATHKYSSKVCDNVITINARRMDKIEFGELCRYFIDEFKAYELFIPYLPSWDDPLPRIIDKVDNETLSSILQVPELNMHGNDQNGNNWVLACIQKKRDLGFVRSLVDHGIDLFAKNNNGENALHLAVKSGNFDTIEYLLSLGFSLEDRDHFQKTALHHAFSNSQTIKYLIEKNANVLAVDVSGNNVAHLAFQTYYKAGTEICVYLLSHHHATEIFKMTNQKGKTPLQEMVEKRMFPSDIKVLELILQKSGEDVNVTDTMGYTMFMRAVSIEAGLEHLKCLLKFGADPNMVSKGTSAFHISAEEGFLEPIKYLVSINVSPELKDSAGNTPLLVAAKRNQVNVVKYLISNQVNVLAVNDEGNNIAHVLTDDDCYEVMSVKLILEYLLTLTQASELFKMTNKKGETPLQKWIASEYSPPDVETEKRIIRICRD